MQDKLQRKNCSRMFRSWGIAVQQRLPNRLSSTLACLSRPLEGLLHFMSGSQDPRLAAMLAAPQNAATRPGRVISQTNARPDVRVRQGEADSVDMPLPPQSSLMTAREVSEKILALMRLCGDGDGVADEELLQQVRALVARCAII
jgi:hypothetical protein